MTTTRNLERKRGNVLAAEGEAKGEKAAADAVHVKVAVRVMAMVSIFRNESEIYMLQV